MSKPRISRAAMDVLRREVASTRTRARMSERYGGAYAAHSFDADALEESLDTLEVEADDDGDK